MTDRVAIVTGGAGGIGAATCRRLADDGVHGRIVHVASRAYLGNPGQANYSAAKAGVIGLTKSLAKELGRLSDAASYLTGDVLHVSGGRYG